MMLVGNLKANPTQLKTPCHDFHWFSCEVSGFTGRAKSSLKGLLVTATVKTLVSMPTVHDGCASTYALHAQGGPLSKIAMKFQPLHSW